MPKGIPKNGVNKGWFKKDAIPHNKGGKHISCNMCGTETWKTNCEKNKKYCSYRCYWKSKIGKKFKNSGQFKKGHTPWNKGLNSGKTSLRKAIQNLQLYKDWRQYIFNYYDYTCQICGKRGGDKEAHHKKQFKHIIKDNNIKTVDDAIKCKELWDYDNGVLVCKKCHQFFRPQVLWIHGQRDSGKTTLAKKIQSLSYRAINLDGDEMRWSISSDLGFSKNDRIENNLRIAKLAKILKRQGFNIIVSTICPYKELRDEVQMITGCKFVEMDGGAENSGKTPYEKRSPK